MGDLAGLDPPELSRAVDVVVRLVLAAVMGGVLGVERERLGKPAGVRTHMLVALGSSLFIVAAAESGAPPDALTRVVQGIATGIGFVGAGTILKHPDEDQVHGLTTAASIWLTAALGTAVGAGHLWVPLLGTGLALVVLAVVGRIERRIRRRAGS